MDSIICDALTEICIASSTGLHLRDLWPRIQAPASSSGLHLCDGVKQAVWAGLLSVPAVQVVAGGQFLGSGDASVQSADEAERLGTKLVAAGHLVDNSLGLYDNKYSGCKISAQQRHTLERLAAARTNGITQSQLAKELAVKENSIFYVVKSLECQGLLVRQSSILRTKDSEAEENGMKIIPTNLMHLHRYAKHLIMSTQQKVEITQKDSPLNVSNGGENVPVHGDTVGEFAKSDVQIRDYLPDMRAICDKLEESNGKVLVVCDIKAALGYGSRCEGRRAWRDILKRLKEAGIVEEIQGEVNKKVLPCLRLRKKFDLTCTSKSPESVQTIKCGRRGQISDQLVELPLESQVHDLIKAEGPKGMLFPEVCERLGVHHKRNRTRLIHIFLKFGMHQEPESHNKSTINRIWTRENSPGNDKKNLDKGQLPELTSCDIGLITHSSSPDLFQDGSGHPNELTVRNIQLVLKETCNEFPGNGHDKQLLVCGTDPVDVSNEDARVQDDVKLSAISDIAKSDAALEASSLSAFSASRNNQICQRYPCLKMTATSMQREQRILERLQDEKFILDVELYKWLEGFEKDKKTTMCRKTLDRHLSKLQKEGLCKRIVVSEPVVSHCWRKRLIRVVLQPSVESFLELLGQVKERMRKFEMQSRGHGIRKSKNNQCAPVLAGVDRILSQASSEVQSSDIKVMKSYGFISAKMVRARLLHNFFWSHLSALPNWITPQPSGGAMMISHGSYQLFALEDAVKAMSLQLFLHVAGSAKKDDTLFQKCRLGLCLSDLAMHDYQCLVDAEAKRRLSLVIDVLVRLKLIRLVAEESTGVTDMVLTYAMELNPYIEEPLSRPQQTSGLTSLDTRQKNRHDFVLSEQQDVDAYWKTLEHCNAATDLVSASHEFPVSAVKEALHFCCNKARSRYPGYMGSPESLKVSNEATRSNGRKRKASTHDRPPKNVNLDAASGQMDEPNILNQDERITCSPAKEEKARRCQGQSEHILNILGLSFERKMCKSLSVANAVELLKVVFLTNSTASGVPELLMMTLMQYSEEDIYTACRYLTEKNFLVNGKSSQSQSHLSKKFLHNTCFSPFPTNSGRRAANFASWLKKKDKDLLEDKIKLDDDLQCGEIFHLFALVYSGELLIAPCLPDEGVGEAEEIRGNKRKTVGTDLSSAETDKKQKSHGKSDSEFARREKGFPGIIASVNRVFIARTETLHDSMCNKSYSSNCCNDLDSSNCCFDLDPLSTPQLFDHVKDCDKVVGSASSSAHPDNSLWTNITDYAVLISADTLKQGLSLCPELFQTAYGVIREAGQQGLKMKEISEISLMNGDGAAEFVVDALEVFGLIIKVNAYDCTHVVDASWRPKYHLKPVASQHQHVKHHSSMMFTGRNDESCWKPAQRYKKKMKVNSEETVVNLCDEHKITIIDADKGAKHCNEATSNERSNTREGYKEDEVSESNVLEDSCAFRPIFPWLNGDGSINNVMYKGLVRRILGTVMQNPGILEDHLIYQMDVLNPQNCRKLLELMVLDDRLSVREIEQTIFSGPPAILGCLFGSNSLEKSQLECRKHLFANPMSTFLL